MNEQKPYLTERIELANSGDLEKLKNQFRYNHELFDLVFKKKLKDTKYKYLALDETVLNSTLYQVMEYVINNKIGVSCFIKDNADAFIGFISYLEDENNPKSIRSVKIFNFKGKENNPDNITFDKINDIFKDTLKIMNGLRDKYDEICLEAFEDNKKAVEIYEMYRKYNKGVVKKKNGILYYVIPGKNNKNFQNAFENNE